MSIKRMEVENYRVFKSRLNIDFCPGINVFIGDNGTGKTTLIKWMFNLVKNIEYNRRLPATPGKAIFYDGENHVASDNANMVIDISDNLHSVYIPEKDILEHARGLLPFIEEKHTGFDAIYKNVLISGFDVYTREQTEIQKSIGEQISNIVGGYVEWDQGDGTFYMVKTNGLRIPFSDEASAYKKLGYLGLLLACGRFKKGTILFWDEPENSLNPELVSVLVDILLKLAKNGVQVFIATHAYDVARYFDVREDKSIPVMFHNLTKIPDGGIACTSSPEYVKLSNNLLDEANEKLFKAVVADALGDYGNE